MNAYPKQWLRWLSLAEFWYNTNLHSAIGRSPFEALYGYSPRTFGSSATDVCSVPSLEEWLKERQLVTDLIKQHLNKATVRMKNQPNKGHTECQFAVDELVFLKMQPYIQSSLANRSNQKLAFKLFGPFRVQ